jgi:glycosyltransferase involved in cell wall biosynthesis
MRSKQPLGDDIVDKEPTSWRAGSSVRDGAHAATESAYPACLANASSVAADMTAEAFHGMSRDISEDIVQPVLSHEQRPLGVDIVDKEPASCHSGCSTKSANNNSLIYMREPATRGLSICRFYGMLGLLGLTLSLTTANSVQLIVTPPDGTFISVAPGARSAFASLRVSAVLQDNYIAGVRSTEFDADACFGSGNSTENQAGSVLTLEVQNLVDRNKLRLQMVRDRGSTYSATITLGNLLDGTQAVNLKVMHKLCTLVTQTHHLEIVPHSLTSRQYLPGSSFKENNKQSLAIPLSHLTSAREPAALTRPIKIVMVGVLALDGQTTIWLEQMAHLPKSQFSFHFVCFGCPDGEARMQIEKGVGFAFELHRLGVPITTKSGMTVRKNFALSPGSTFVKKATSVLRRWHRLQRYNLSSFSDGEIGFLRDFNEFYVEALQKFDILVLGNRGREDPLTHLVIEAARIAGVKRIVMELTTAYDGMLQNNNIDALVSPSEFALSRLFYSSENDDNQKRDGRVKQPKVAIVNPPGIDTRSVFAAHRSLSADLPYTRRKLKVGYVARLSPLKSPGIFLKAAKEIVIQMASKITKTPTQPLVRQEIEFLVVGDGPMRQYMEELGQNILLSFTNTSEIARVVNVSLRFLGWMTRADLGRIFLPTLDVLLNPSVTPETFCIANIEAMAVGIPVVSFGIGGIGEYLNKRVNGTAGFVVGTQGQLSDTDGEQWPRLMARLAVSVLTMDARSRAELRKSSSDHVKQYDVEISLSKSAKIYEKLLMADEAGHFGRRASQSSAGKVFRLMARPKVRNIYEYNREAVADILETTVNDEGIEELFALLLSGAILGRTHRALLVRMKESTQWFRLILEPSELASFAVMGKTGWRDELGHCPLIGEIAKKAAHSPRPDQHFQSCGGGCPGIAKNTNLVAGPGLVDRFVVGVATSWAGVEEAGGVTLIHGQDRTVNFILDEALGSDVPLVVLFLGIDPEFSRARGGIFCS